MPESESDSQRESKAITLAEERGRREQLVKGRLDDHQGQLTALNGHLKGMESELRGVKDTVRRWTDEVSKKDAVQAALVKAAQDLAAKQVTARQLYLSLGIFLVALVALLYGSGHFG